MSPAAQLQVPGTDGAALVLDGHSRAGLATLQSLGRLGVAVDLAAGGESLAARSRYCRRPLVQPDTADTGRFVDWLEDRFDADGYRLVVPATEASLRCLLQLPEDHRIRQAAVLSNNRAMEIALSKQLTWEFARQHDVPVPASRLLTSTDDIEAPQTFPVVLKPTASLVNVGDRVVGVAPAIVSTAAEWSAVLARLLPLCPIQEQEYVAGRGIGIELLYRHGTRHWYFQHERIHEMPLTGGGSTYRRSTQVDIELLERVTGFLGELNWHGVAMVEFKQTAQGDYSLMEINPRLWGSLPLSISAGVDFPRGLWCIATGQEPGRQPDYKSPHYVRNVQSDLDWFKENLNADHANTLLLTRPRAGAFLEFGRLLTGHERWDHFDLRDWRVWTFILGDTTRSAARTGYALVARAIRQRLLARHHRKVLARLDGENGLAIERILFVCYGNICRSPLAEIHARSLGPGLEVDSTGFHETVERTAPEWYQAVCSSLGIELSDSRSKCINAAQVERAQLIILADTDNLDEFKRRYPDAMHKTTMLGMFLPVPRATIDDPYTQDPGSARHTAREVMTAVERLVASI